MPSARCHFASLSRDCHFRVTSFYQLIGPNFFHALSLQTTTSQSHFADDSGLLRLVTAPSESWATALTSFRPSPCRTRKESLSQRYGSIVSERDGHRGTREQVPGRRRCLECPGIWHWHPPAPSFSLPSHPRLPPRPPPPLRPPDIPGRQPLRPLADSAQGAVLSRRPSGFPGPSAHAHWRFALQLGMQLSSE